MENGQSKGVTRGSVPLPMTGGPTAPCWTVVARWCAELVPRPATRCRRRAMPRAHPFGTRLPPRCTPVHPCGHLIIRLSPPSPAQFTPDPHPEHTHLHPTFPRLDHRHTDLGRAGWPSTITPQSHAAGRVGTRCRPPGAAPDGRRRRTPSAPDRSVGQSLGSPDRSLEWPGRPTDRLSAVRQPVNVPLRSAAWRPQGVALTIDRPPRTIRSGPTDVGRRAHVPPAQPPDGLTAPLSAVRRSRRVHTPHSPDAALLGALRAGGHSNLRNRRARSPAIPTICTPCPPDSARITPGKHPFDTLLYPLPTQPWVESG